jgi:hypothetical protein
MLYCPGKTLDGTSDHPQESFRETGLCSVHQCWHLSSGRQPAKICAPNRATAVPIRGTVQSLHTVGHIDNQEGPDRIDGNIKATLCSAYSYTYI